MLFVLNLIQIAINPKLTVMKKSILLSTVLVLMFSFLLSNNQLLAQDSKHIVGVGVGRVAYGDNILYVNTAVGDDWFKYSNDIILNLSYNYKVFPYFRIGSYFEFESATLESDIVKGIKGSRFDFGAQWFGEYPETKLRLQLGGYFAFSVLSNEVWKESVKGINYGIMAGPCYHFGKVSVALHVHAGMSPYFGEVIEDVDILAPKVFLKVFYNL